MKIVLSNKIYIKVPEDEAKELKKTFTFKIPDPYNESRPNYIPRYVSQAISFNKEVLQISRGHIAYLKEKYPDAEIVDRTISNNVYIPEPIFILRPDQQKILNDFMSTVENEGIYSALCNGNPGFGKTITGLAIAHRLQEKTLVVCTTTAIRDQWVSEVKKWFNLDPGIIGSGSITNMDSPIVIGNIQTVVKFKAELSKLFGLLIIDECHHCSASTFNEVVEFSHAKYRLGLSGTLVRKDGLHCLFPGLFGSKVFIPEESNTVDPTIVRLHTGITIPGNYMVPWAQRINDLYNNEKYRYIIKYILRMAIENGYKPLITSDRVEMLKWLLEQEPNMRLFIGEAPYNNREVREKYIQEVLDGEADGILASTNIFSEGMSVNNLSFLMHLSSTNNESLIAQLIGRVRRIHKGKKQPIVLDFIFEGDTGSKHAKERMKFYKTKPWKIKDISNYESLLKILAD